MTDMVLLLLSAACCVLVGFAIGVLVGAWAVDGRRSCGAPVRRIVRQPVDPEPDDYIDRAAESWAQAHRMPGAAALISEKVRLLSAIQERRARRRGWWP